MQALVFEKQDSVALITGGTGFFGKSMLDYRLRHPEMKWPEWVILSRDPDRFARAHPLLANQRGVTFITGDIRSFAAPDRQIDTIIHAAADLDANAGTAEQTSTILQGTEHVIEIARQTCCSKVLFTSSGAVYGNMNRPAHEDDPCNPVTPYGRAKLQAEQLLASSGLDIKIARCFAFVGKHLDRSIHYAVGNFIRDALCGKDIVITGDGLTVRSYLYADDLVEWLLKILEHGTSCRPYNVGSDEALTILELANQVRHALHSTSDVHTLGLSSQGKANYYVPVIERVKTELGLSARHKIEDAIRLSAQVD